MLDILATPDEKLDARPPKGEELVLVEARQSNQVFLISEQLKSDSTLLSYTLETLGQ